MYIAYEYVPGRTLRHALDHGELDDERAVEAAAQILDGLAHAHERGIVHRDIKPSNVLLADGPGISVRLLDFGLALVTEEETLTAAGDVPGTLAYISPERLRGKPAEPSTDVWSTGVLLWEALAHRHPFGGGQFLDVAKKIGRGAPSLASVRPDLPGALTELVDQALAVDPGKRPPAARLAANLRRALHTRDRHRPVPVPALRRVSLAHLPILRRIGPAVPAALLVGWTTANLAFFPAYWPAALAAVAALLTFLGPRLGLAFALAVPVLPLGNIALGLAIAYGIAACAWFALFWAVPRAGLLFVAGPLLAPFGALGLIPLAALPARDPGRRAAVAVTAVLSAGMVAGTRRAPPPPRRRRSGRPLDRRDRRPTRRRLCAVEGTGRVACIPARNDRARGGGGGRRSPAPPRSLGRRAVRRPAAHADAPVRDPGAAALPLVAAAWASALLLVLEPGPRRPLPPVFARVRRIPLRKPRLRLLAGS